MTDYVVIVALGALAVIVVTELLAAVLPVVIVIAMVPPHEREGLARLLAACDSSRRLRLWPALRLAVMMRREERRNGYRGERRDEARWEELNRARTWDSGYIVRPPAMPATNAGGTPSGTDSDRPG
ncbi:hypothetical protein [Actinoplanes sp. DH11]|uniref:hypothetical protein n=1 Tax=Actinoplanes sp. DH11 TaxID=2857011 RepID=UPI001E654D78|nr:hypothetical protein [Actinoplanes sp. DH11]